MPVFVVATVNRHEVLPPELLSRFQKTFFVGLPDRGGREEIVRIHLAKRGLDPTALRAGDLADATPGFNGRELRNCVQAALQAAFADGRAAVTLDRLVAAARAITPLSVARSGEIKAIEAWARENNVEDASGPDEAAPAASEPARRIRKGGK